MLVPSKASRAEMNLVTVRSTTFKRFRGKKFKQIFFPKRFQADFFAKKIMSNFLSLIDSHMIGLQSIIYMIWYFFVKRTLIGWYVRVTGYRSVLYLSCTVARICYQFFIGRSACRVSCCNRFPCTLRYFLVLSEEDSIC